MGGVGVSDGGTGGVGGGEGSLGIRRSCVCRDLALIDSARGDRHTKLA